MTESQSAARVGPSEHGMVAHVAGRPVILMGGGGGNATCTGVAGRANSGSHRQTQAYPVGTQFVPNGNKRKDICTVTDFLVTRNLAGEIVRERYVATHIFMGQTVTDHDVVATTIARGLITAAQ